MGSRHSLANNKSSGGSNAGAGLFKEVQALVQAQLVIRGRGPESRWYPKSEEQAAEGLNVSHLSLSLVFLFL